MTQAVVWPSSAAEVGAGTRLGDLSRALAAAGRALPVGCGASVGIAGLTLGGGFGVLGRRYGLTCDRLVGARVVLADGRIVDCDAEHEAELFWALRGAGFGHFAVVTSLLFDTVPAPEAVTCFEIRWAPVDARAAVEAWQEWAPLAPDEVHAELRLTVAPDHEPAPRVTVVGTILRTAADAQPLLGDYLPGSARDQRRSGHPRCPTRRRNGTSPTVRGAIRHLRAARAGSSTAGRSSSGSHCLRGPWPTCWATSAPLVHRVRETYAR